MFKDFEREKQLKESEQFLDELQEELEEKQIYEKQSLQEMSRLSTKKSGLPVDLYIDDSKSYIRGRHAKIIKFQANSDDSRTESFSSMTLDGNIVPETLPKKHSIKTKDIEKISNFVKNNVFALEKIADKEIDFQDFMNVMIKKTESASADEIENQKEQVNKIIEKS